MRGCGCLFGALLIPIAVVGLLFFLVVPAVMDVKTIPPLNNALQTILCEKGETLSTKQHVGPSDDGGTSYSATFYCNGDDSVQREVTGRAVMIGIVAFLVPFMLGLFLIISTSFGLAGRAAAQAVGVDPSALFTVSLGSQRPPAATTGANDVTERLRSLKSAYDQGLITQEEYERKRQEILREM